MPITAMTAEHSYRHRERSATGQRTIVVGDVHGCLQELDDLLRLTEYRHGCDRLVFAGDLVDRGPDPAGVVRRVRELGADCVLGNHDERHVRWARHEAMRVRKPGYKNPMRPLSPQQQRHHDALSAGDLAFLAALPPYLHLDAHWLVVHGGFRPGVPLAEQKPALLARLRYVDEDGRPLQYDPAAPPPPGALFWTERWTGPEHVIYGHMVHDLEQPRIDEPVPGVRCYGLDTGCCFGGRLTALLLPDCEIVQVPARDRYAPFTHAED